MAGELFDTTGARKYLTAGERAAFLVAANRAPREVRTFRHVLHFTGCRISEALALTADRVDFAACVITFESLKKRRGGVYRSVPVPPRLLEVLDLVHDIRAMEARQGRRRKVNAIIDEADVGAGPQATAKGLRHGFGVAAVTNGIPLNLVQKWLGHTQLSTTAIYADAVGAEEASIASRMWTTKE